MLPSSPPFTFICVIPGYLKKVVIEQSQEHTHGISVVLSYVSRSALAVLIVITNQQNWL
jgi:hypothetical protein